MGYQQQEVTMQVEQLKIDPKDARELYRAYKTHLHWTPQEDAEIRRVYQLIAQGRVVIRAMETIARAGVNAEGLPNLAICRADLSRVRWFPSHDGGGVFEGPVGSKWRKNSRTGNALHLPPGTFQRRGPNYQYEALLPPIPDRVMPKRGLANYHVLWEAEWRRVIPADPYLLRQIGRGDTWLVVAAWDLTEVERAALATRLNG